MHAVHSLKCCSIPWERQCSFDATFLQRPGGLSPRLATCPIPNYVLPQAIRRVCGISPEDISSIPKPPRWNQAGGGDVPEAAEEHPESGRHLSLQAKFARLSKRSSRVSPSKVRASLQAKFTRLSKQSSRVSPSKVRASLQAKFVGLLWQPERKHETLPATSVVLSRRHQPVSVEYRSGDITIVQFHHDGIVIPSIWLGYSILMVLLFHLYGIVIPS